MRLPQEGANSLLRWVGCKILESYLAPVLVKRFKYHLVFGLYDLKFLLAMMLSVILGIVLSL